MIKVILGPPGSGKTTKLIQICAEAIRNGIDERKVGYVSFTKKAAIEAVTRATDSFATGRELPYFRTIHSLAFWSLRYNRQQVFSIKHLADFSRRHGYSFTTRSSFQEDGTFVGRTDDDKSFFLINLARNKLTKLRDEVASTDVEYNETVMMYQRYAAYKEHHKLLDFTDMLQNYINKGIPDTYPQLDLLCIDEAQDLSALQWLAIEYLIKFAKTVYIAGDDDQAIYEWSGADVKTFINYAAKNESETLAKSYRFGYGIYWQGLRVLAKIKQRIHKEYIPLLDDKGVVRRISDIEVARLNEGSVLILARSFYLLKEVVDYLEDEHVDWSYTTDKKDTPIKVGTIHSVKGGEADNVVLLTDISRTTWDSKDTDAEHRVWYTAVTRAKKCLYIVEPRTDYYYEI